MSFTHQQIELVARLMYASRKALTGVLHAAGVDYLPNRQNPYYVEKVLRNLDACMPALKQAELWE